MESATVQVLDRVTGVTRAEMRIEIAAIREQLHTEFWQAYRREMLMWFVLAFTLQLALAGFVAAVWGKG